MKIAKKYVFPATLLLLVATMYALFSSLPFVAFGQEEYPRDQTIIFTVSTITAYNNWNQYTAAFENWAAGWEIVSEPLFWNQVDNGTILPVLATGYEMSPDAKIYTIHIRDDVYWNDGTKWGMDDIMYTFDVLSRFEGLDFYGWYQKNIEKVERIDDLTFKITLKDPNAHFISSDFSGVVQEDFYVLPKHAYEKYDDPSTCENKEHVWTGPYNLVRAEADLFIWERRDDYWGAAAHGWKPGPKYVIFRNVGTTEEALMALSKGDVDNLYHEGGWWSTYQQVKSQNPDVTIWYAPDFCQDDLFFNLHKYPFNLKEFRWAISYAINRTAFVQIFGEGIMGRESVGPYAMPAMEKWMPEDLRRKYPLTYDLKKMEELLLSIGFTKDADGFWHDANGTLCEYELRHPDWMREFARLLGEQLTSAGIKALVKEYAWAPYWSDVAKGYVGAEMIYGWAGAGMGCAAADPYDFFKNMYSPFALPLGEIGGLNRLRFKNERLDALFPESMVVPLDSPRAEELNHEMYEIYLQELPMVPIWDKPDVMICNNQWWVNWPVSPPLEGSYARPAAFWYQIEFVLLGLKPSGRKLPGYVEPWVYPTIAAVVVVVAAGAGFIVYRRRIKK